MAARDIVDVAYAALASRIAGDKAAGRYVARVALVIRP
ncbi:hypothetical protein C7S16_0200 [Burkholderia thailandensis]|uniref:Uncharacterized protein n=1 Tax=Burkholderia thailandensis TaxID=57975 RepID=A0AAW9D077_BURTH|nr:hypothetical protein [Burkholderia thailandensis]MDW9256207.1 hypothetical protein [Burkholderia thailandensis]